MGMIQEHYTHCALYFYSYYISSISDQQGLDPRGWGTPALAYNLQHPNTILPFLLQQIPFINHVYHRRHEPVPNAAGVIHLGFNITITWGACKICQILDPSQGDQIKITGSLLRFRISFFKALKVLATEVKCYYRPAPLASYLFSHQIRDSPIYPGSMHHHHV